MTENHVYGVMVNKYHASKGNTSSKLVGILVFSLTRYPRWHVIVKTGSLLRKYKHEAAVVIPFA